MQPRRLLTQNMMDPNQSRHISHLFVCSNHWQAGNSKPLVEVFAPLFMKTNWASLFVHLIGFFWSLSWQFNSREEENTTSMVFQQGTDFLQTSGWGLCVSCSCRLTFTVCVRLQLAPRWRRDVLQRKGESVLMHFQGCMYIKLLSEYF